MLESIPLFIIHVRNSGSDMQVTRIFSRHVNVDILAVGDDPLPLSFKGQIRYISGESHH